MFDPAICQLIFLKVVVTLSFKYIDNKDALSIDCYYD